MYRRIGIAIAATLLVLVGTAAPATARPRVISSWTAFDVDGSNLTLLVYADGWTYSLDDYASVCGGGTAKIYGPGSLDARSNLVSADWTVSCANGPLLGPFTVTFRTLIQSFVMRDSTGVTWYRAL